VDILKNRSVPITAPALFNSRIPPALDACVMRLLSADPDLRPALDDVLETLAAWVGTRRPQRPARQRSALPPEPYKLLSYYGREDAALYFGRDREVAELTDALDQPRLRLLSVFGPCGIGKSSGLRAS